MSSCAACKGLPISGRRLSCAPAPPAASAAATATAAAALEKPLLDELFIPDHSELGDAQALRRGEDERHGPVFDELVRPDVNLGLVRLRRRLRQARLERGTIGNRLAVPGDRA